MDTIARETLQAERRASLALPPDAQHERGQERRARVRNLPPEERAALIDAAAHEAGDARARVAQALALPPLAGDDRQSAKAQEIRATRIEQALALTMGLRDGTVAYRLWAGDNPLHVDEVPGAGDGEYADEDALLAALTAAVTHTPRLSASWWIDYLNGR